MLKETNAKSVVLIKHKDDANTIHNFLVGVLQKVSGFLLQLHEHCLYKQGSFVENNRLLL